MANLLAQNRPTIAPISIKLEDDIEKLMQVCNQVLHIGKICCHFNELTHSLHSDIFSVIIDLSTVIGQVEKIVAAL